MGGSVLVTAPTVEPISLAEARLFVKAPTTADDTLIQQFITAARKRVEQLTGRAFVTQTWDYFCDAFPAYDPLKGYAIELPLPPLQSVTSVKYTDSAGVETTVSGSDYYVDTASQPGRVIPNIDKSWPTAVLRVANGVAIRFVAGYGAASAVPESLKAKLYRLIGHFYAFRTTDLGVPPELDQLFLEDYAAQWA